MKFIKKTARTLLTPIKEESTFFLLCALMLLQNTIFSWRDWTVYNIITFTTSSFFYSYVATISCHFTKSRILKIVIYTFLTFICIVNIYLRFQLMTRISPNIIQLLFETNIQECIGFFKTYLSWHLLLILFCASILYYKIIVFFEKYKEQFSPINNNHVLYAIAFLIALGAQSTYKIYSSLYTCNNTIEIDYWVYDNETIPMDNLTNLVYSLYDVHLMKKEIYSAISSTQDIKGDATTKTDSLNILLIIGESFNKYHSNLYGYYLNTTPHLLEENKKGNLFVFNDVISPYNLTTKVLRNMLCTNCIGEGESWSNYPFFPSIFIQAGYNVYFWDNQYNPISREVFDYSLNHFLHNPIINKLSYSKTNSTNFKYDDQLITDYIHETKEEKKKLNLSIFHLMGQHFLYYDRFPHNKTFDYYTEDSINNKYIYLSNESKKVIADYDNATRYNDYVINMITNHFKEKNAIMVYLSDHGEEVYDYINRRGRVLENPIPKQAMKYQFEIPFFIWCSDIYIKKNPNTVSQIKAAINRPFSSDNLCHLLFHIGQIKTKQYKAERDLLSPSYNCPPRLIEGTTLFIKSN